MLRHKNSMNFRLMGSCLAVMVMEVFFFHTFAGAVPINVRFQEGVTHGFLLVRSLGGDILGQGEMTQVAKEGNLVESRLVFKFKDGSLHDEKVAFSQNGVFTLISYHLVQRGPFFPEQVDVFFDRGTGEYKVHIQAGKDEKEEVRAGKFELPKDVYNGMVVMMALNLPKGSSETVRILTFTPDPELVKLELLPRGEHTVRIGDQSRKALRYAFKPDIGMIRKWVGRIIGKLPDRFHYHCWILDDEVPSFVHYEGPLQLLGPIVRIELLSPSLVIPPQEETSP
jgi:hypothetical protein